MRIFLMVDNPSKVLLQIAIKFGSFKNNIFHQISQVEKEIKYLDSLMPIIRTSER